MIVGTLSKALGAYGGYVCTRREIAELLVNRSRTLIFSTAPPPPAVAGAHAALELLVEQPRRPQKLQAAAAVAAARARRGRRAGARRAHADHAGDRRRRRRARSRSREALLARGVFAQAIRPPTVPDGSSRLRLTVMASHTASELTAAAAAIRDAASADGRDASRRAAARGRRRRRVSGASRLLRHRDRHRRRQDDPLRGAGREPARPRRAGARAQARPHRARRGAAPPITSCSRRSSARAPEEVAPLRYGPAVSPHLAAALERPADRRRRRSRA